MLETASLSQRLTDHILQHIGQSGRTGLRLDERGRDAARGEALTLLYGRNRVTC